MNKAHIVESLRRKFSSEGAGKPVQRPLFPEMQSRGLTKRRAAQIVDSLFEIIKGRLEKGEDVLITGFGRFKVRFKWARKGRHPQTGESIIIPSRKTVVFQASRKLKDRINGVEDKKPGARS